jgi:hypothetical protein
MPLRPLGFGFCKKVFFFKCHACVPLNEMKIKDDSQNVARQLVRDFLSIGKVAATPNDKNCLSPTRTHSNLTVQFPYPIMYSFGTLYSTGTVSFISSHESFECNINQ